MEKKETRGPSRCTSWEKSLHSQLQSGDISKNSESTCCFPFLSVYSFTDLIKEPSSQVSYSKTVQRQQRSLLCYYTLLYIICVYMYIILYIIYYTFFLTHYAKKDRSTKDRRRSFGSSQSEERVELLIAF